MNISLDKYDIYFPCQYVCAWTVIDCVETGPISWCSHLCIMWNSIFLHFNRFMTMSTETMKCEVTLTQTALMVTASRSAFAPKPRLLIRLRPCARRNPRNSLIAHSAVCPAL